MQAVYEINKDVVYVKGAVRGAIYNFTTGKVFSINEEACDIVDTYIQNHESVDFITELEKDGLVSKDFCPKEYEFPAIKKRLQFVWLELTEACNLRCIHCYEGDVHKDVAKERLTFEQWISVLDQLKELKRKNIEFIGGEPTVHPRFKDLLEYACAIGLKIDIFSNLLRFNDELIEFIKQNNITVHFSLYGSNSQTHDSITGMTGSFDKTMSWAQKLVANGVRTIPAISVMRKNQNDYENILNLLKSRGFSMDLLSVDVVRSSDKRDSADLLPTPEAARIAYRTKAKFFASKGFFNRARYFNTCLYGKFNIQPNGNVSPCEFCRDVICGNVKEQPIAEVIKSERLNQLWNLDYSKIEKCKCCEYRFACKDCRLANSTEEMDKKNVRCLYDPEKGLWER